MQSNVMLRFMVQGFQDPPLCGSTFPTPLLVTSFFPLIFTFITSSSLSSLPQTHPPDASPPPSSPSSNLHYQYFSILLIFFPYFPLFYTSFLSSLIYWPSYFLTISLSLFSLVSETSTVLFLFSCCLLTFNLILFLLFYISSKSPLSVTSTFFLILLLVILLQILYCFYYSISFYSVFCERDLHIPSHSLAGHPTMNLTY